MWVQAGVGLGNLATWVTPEDPLSAQPLAAADAQVVLTADARVDNRDELVPRLRAAGWLGAAVPSDAEVILAAYRRWGDGCAARLVGDYAFVVWDGPRRRLFAARDPLGMRPLYYRVEAHRVLVASEIAQLLADPTVPARIHEPMVALYLCGAPGPPQETFYDGVAALPAGHALTVEARQTRTWRHWDPDPGHRIRYRNTDDYAEHLQALFTQAVAARLRSRGPVGVLLSGGLDSGSIAATAGWLTRHHDLPTAVHTYSWAFHDLPACDERHISRLTTDHYQLPAIDIPADDAWPLAGWPDHGPHRDDPHFGVYQPLLDRALATAAAHNDTLVLSGDRGDLLVGDWLHDHLGMALAGRWRAVARELRWQAAQGRGWPKLARRHLLLPLAATLWPAGLAPGLRRRLRPNPARIPAWVNPSFAARAGLAERLAEAGTTAPAGPFAWRQRYGLIFAPLHLRGVVWSERTNARFGLGFADPWSDRRLAAYILAIPQWVVQTPSRRKHIARQAMRGVMPEPARQAATKIYPTALYELAVRDRARGTVTDLLTGTVAGAAGWLDESAARGLHDSFRADGPAEEELWWPLSLEGWLRQHW